jgi:hypothetical protein
MPLVTKARSLGQALLRPLRRLIHRYLFPVIDSKEFKAVYPVLVISLGALAVFHTDTLRTIVIIVALSVLALTALIGLVRDTQRITLAHKWNLMFLSYYRPFLISLTHRLNRSLDDDEPIDIHTHRTGDFVTALREAATDFEQVSGSRKINISTFDIEYVPLLKAGVTIDGTEYKLISLAEAWESTDSARMLSYPLRIPEEVQFNILQRIDRYKLYALPIGWGVVGVSIIHNELTPEAVVRLVSNDQAGFSFDKFLENAEELKREKYTVFCFDFWSGIGQLVSLYRTGHMNITDAEYPRIRESFQKLLRSIDPNNVISEPQVLLERIKTVEKAVIIGGSTWLGLKGTLLPVEIPGGKPVYGAFCECLGMLSPPEGTKKSAEWESDASKLVGWLADHLADRSRAPTAGPGSGSIVNNYLPGILRETPRRKSPNAANAQSQQAMHWDPKYEKIFRQFPSDSLERAQRMKALWDEAKVEALAVASIKLTCEAN